MDDILRDKPWFKELLKKPEFQDITLIDLYKFYLTNNNIYKVLPIITSNSHISIRVLDWFVTNYSKKFNLIYQLDNKNTNGEKYFNVFLQYKCQLKSYKKKFFDPFCRKQRIYFHYDLNKCVITTIGQLNFFKWAISFGILSYVEKNLQSITNDMIISNKIMISKYNNNQINDPISSSTTSSTINITNDHIFIDDIIISPIKTISSELLTSSDTQLGVNNITDSEKIRKKRHELSISAIKTVNLHNYSVILSFD